MSHYSQRQLLAVAERAAAKKHDPTRHKCFISYHAEDTEEVKDFLEDFGSEFIAKTIGVTEEDDFIDSENTDYIMGQIRQKYLGNSTVTIVLVGKCTWARRFIDWEVYSSLRSSKLSTVNGLLAIELPSAAEAGGGKMPPRVADNVERSNGYDIGYARYYTYPQSANNLRNLIDDAFDARTSRKELIKNDRERKKYNSSCS
ncbi:TIR domain-containing protein [Nocardia farcinica]|uniref:TIR domain-containing protein n=1 Tax=Nocardia farcinica TaxID=37329 RepID=UPI0024575356|nr:TIR domain-containing protein [Nocardia farcinica]